LSHLAAATCALQAGRIDQGWFPNGLTFAPYPKDQMVYQSPTIVQYRTPPNTKGLGTEWASSKPNEHPIDGLVMLTNEASRPLRLVFGAVRLPPELADLTPTIIQEVRDFDGWSKL
jgi:hypothetical protein